MRIINEQVIKFIKNSPGVIYSLLLVIIVPLIVYIGIYLSLVQFEDRFNQLNQSKAFLMENVFTTLTKGTQLDIQTLQEKINEIAGENSSVSKIQIVSQKKDGPESFVIIASTDQAEIGQPTADDKHGLLLVDPKGVYANIDTYGEERFWEVAKILPVQDDGNSTLFLKTWLTLKDVDEAFWASMQRTYIIIFVATIVMVLLVSNYVRLTKYIMMFHRMKEIDQMKDDFISMASHELKTPLVAISGFADLLSSEKGASLDDEAKQYVSNIRVSSDRLKNLVNDILEVSRIEQDRIPFQMEKTDANEIVSKVVDNLHLQAQEKGLKLLFEKSPAPAIVSIDRQRMEQILINLVGNAIKYTPKGEVIVQAHKKGEEIFISVKDSGLGMSADQQKRLFEKFYRIKDENRSKIPGTGLGLWITKQLIEKMQGEISVESMEGVGSKFIISFPEAKELAH